MPSPALPAADTLSVNDILRQASQSALKASPIGMDAGGTGDADRSIVSGRLLSRQVARGLFINAHDVLYLRDCALDADKECSLSCGLLLGGDVAPIGVAGHEPVRQTRGRPFLLGLGQPTRCERRWQAGTRSRGAGITLTPAFLDRYADQVEDGELAGLRAYLRPGTRSALLPASAPLAQLATRLVEHGYRGSLADLFLESSALAFVLQLATMLRDEARIARRLSPWHSRRVAEAREILDAHLANPPSSTELARQVGVNLTTLQENFKAAYGTTLFAYVRAERLKLARHLICEQGLGIAEAGYSVGFGNPAAFTAAYRRHFGQPPSAERGAARN
jgi:AraC-like DNA-binding protein